MEKPEDLVVLGEYPDAVSAYIIKGVLNTNGIECVISNEHMSGLLPLADLPIGRITLHVFRKDLSKANQIIESNSCDEETPAND